MSHQNTHGLPETNTIHGCNKQRFNSHTDTTTLLEVLDSLPSPFLPEDLILEILSRLPVKSLLRFRCVCKSWKSLIFDPQLVKKQLHRSISDTHFTHHRLLPFPILDLSIDLRIPCSVKSLFNNSSNPMLGSSLILEPIHMFRIIGSCNGLLCCLESWACLTLYNPCTGLKSKESPIIYDDTAFPSMVFGFGYDDQTDKYKVVILYFSYNNGTDEAHVYTFGDDDSWRQIKTYSTKLILPQGPPSFLSGTLNWLVKPWNEAEIPKSELILSFDLGKETFGKVLLPVGKVSYNLESSIGVLRDCLYFSDENMECTHCFVWLMKEYGVKESWTKLYTISYMDFGQMDRVRFPVLPPMPLFMSENGEVLLQIKYGKFALYNPKDNTFKYFEFEGLYYHFCNAESYVESLVSPCY